MKLKGYLGGALCAALAGCASASTIQTSQDTAIIQSSAAPACGGIGAAKVAQKQAAIATLKAGYDRYIIVSAAAANNVSVYQTPGSYSTSGFVSGNSLYATTTYRPGVPIVAGSHDQSFGIKMFKDGDPQGANALSARAALGPDWQKQVKHQILTCAD